MELAAPVWVSGFFLFIFHSSLRYICYFFGVDDLHFRHTLGHPCFDPVLRMSEPKSYALLAQAEALIRRKQYEEAFPIAQEAIRAGDNNPNAYFMFGVVLLHLGYLRESIVAFKKNLEFEPRNSHAHNNIGTAHRRLGLLIEAGHHHRQAIHIQPDHAGARVNLAGILCDLRQYAEAAEQCRIAVNIDGTLAQAHHGLAEALRGLGKVDEAIAHYRKALELAPEQALTQRRLAELAGKP
jgi:tetratricopeptide (TPR) repeat protein